MSMCFFEMDITTQEIVVSPRLWVFFLVSIPLATFTVLLWRLITLRSKCPESKGEAPDEFALAKKTFESV